MKLEVTTEREATLSTPRTLKPVFESLCLLAVVLIGCGNSPRGIPAPGGATWRGTESCNATLLMDPPDAGTEVVTTLPSTIMDVTAAVTQTANSIVLTGVDLGPVAGWSCANQTLVATREAPDDSVLTRFSLSTAMCSTPTSDGGTRFEFKGEVVMTPGTNGPILSLQLNLSTPEADVERYQGGYWGYCILYLTPP